jgi:hypothetical protein
MGEKKSIRGLIHHHSMDLEMEGRLAGLYAGLDDELEGRPLATNKLLDENNREIADQESRLVLELLDCYAIDGFGDEIAEHLRDALRAVNGYY